MSASRQIPITAQGRLTLPMRLMLRAARGLRYGSLEIHLPGRPPQLFSGPEAGPEGVLEVRDSALFGRLLSRGDLGFAEAYMAGEWSTPDLAELLTCLDRNLESFASLDRGRALLRWVQALRQRFLRRNNRRGSRRNIAYHYDLGNDFYRLWLDSGMTYSSALFEGSESDLLAAQSRKYERLLSLTGAGQGDHILEIGCGWGGFAVHAARSRGCRVTGLTLSREQYEWARQAAVEAGVDELVDIRLQDYRDVTGQFDHVVSIEMFEAVGEAYWPVFFRALHDRLRPGGKAALQVITIDESVFEQYRRDVDFIRQYIFPGGVLPSPTAFNEQVVAAGLQASHREFHGEDYARTLAMWSRSFRQRQREVEKQGFDRSFIRMWEYYLAYCEAGFRGGRINLMQTVLQRGD